MYYADWDLDRYVRENFFRDFNYKGTMVEVGAGPPKFISCSKHFRNFGWRCICVDPNPKFVQQHKDDGSEIYQYACCDREGEANFTINLNNDNWYSSENDGVSFSSLGIRYDNLPEHNSQSVITVQTIKLNTLLENVGVQKVDYVCIDVEGWELDVMRGFDTTKYQPRVIVMENIKSNIEYKQYMNSIGYERQTILTLNDVYVNSRYF